MGDAKMCDLISIGTTTRKGVLNDKPREHFVIRSPNEIQDLTIQNLDGLKINEFPAYCEQQGHDLNLSERGEKLILEARKVD